MQFENKIKSERYEKLRGVDAIEASASDRTPWVPVNATYLRGADDIKKSWRKGRKRTDHLEIHMRDYRIVMVFVPLQKLD